MIKRFDNVYADKDLRKKVDSLAWRYFSSYRYQFNILGMGKEDITQELWMRLWQSKDYDKKNIINRMIDDIYDMLKASTRKKRSFEYADNEMMAHENESGELETDDETMARIVYHGQGRYVS